jgi:hypothetical protein
VSLELVRAAAVIAALVVLYVAVQRRERTLEVLRKFWLEPTSPVNVAVLRIIVFYLLHRSAIGQNPVWYTRLPESQRSLPWGWGWLGSLPFDERLASGAEIALIVSAALASVGLFTRVSAPLAALLAVYVLGLPNFFWKINHGHHLRVLFALALACAPCGDALSLDRLWKRWRGHAAPEPSAAYTIPMRVAWLLVGTSYLFPGLWKLWVSGDLWISGAQLKAHLYDSWAVRPDFEPLYRIDQHDWLLALLGVATLVFEIGFIVCVLNRTTRTLAALSAVAFHVGVASFMGIRFSPYPPLVLLLEIPERYDSIRSHVPRRLLAAAARTREQLAARAHALFERFRRPPSSTPWPPRSATPAALVGMALLFGQTYTGLASISSWPFSVYPQFSSREERPRTVASTLRFYLESKDGNRVDLLSRLRRRIGVSRVKRLVRSLEKAAQPGGTKNTRSVVEVFRLAGVRLEPKDRIAIYEATWNVIPPGEQSAYRETLSKRFVVTSDGALRLERPNTKRPSDSESTPRERRD